MGVDSMTEMASFKVTIADTSSLSLKELRLEGTSYDFASQLLRQKEFVKLYECSTSVLSPFQRELYENLIQSIPKGFKMLLDPIILSFALKDACDLSGAVYVWLDLDGNDEVGNSAWVKQEDQKKVINSVVNLLRRHLEKYIIDAYDRSTREDLVGIWEAQTKLEACPICGSSSPERKLIVTNRRKLRGWICHDCNNHIIVPSDALDYLNNSRNLKLQMR